MANKNKKYKRSIEDAGRISDEQYYNIMEDVAARNYKDWGLPNSDAALVQALNDNTYNYRGYYNKYPNGNGNAKDHWTDEFKTVYHPTFSNESIYSGKKSQYNPKGLTGGTWYGEYFVPSVDLLIERNKFEKGGSTKKPVTTGGVGYVPHVSEDMIDKFKEKTAEASKKAMFYIWDIGTGNFKNPFTYNWSNNKMNNYESGIAQDAFLLPRKFQEEQFLKAGYIKGKKGDYGLVKKAVGKHNYPVYQKTPDAISRNNLIVLGNTYTSLLDHNIDLEHAGSAPGAIYTDGHGNFYQKRWDLNDYGGEDGSTASFAGKILDFIGNPTVVTTGFQPIRENYNPLFYSTLAPIMEKKGLVPTKIDGKTQWTLPEVIIKGESNKKKNGGSIYIKPSKQGTLTAAATKHNMGVQEFASKVLRNKDSYSPAMVKKANFARNASKWNK